MASRFKSQIGMSCKWCSKKFTPKKVWMNACCSGCFASANIDNPPALDTLRKYLARDKSQDGIKVEPYKYF